MEDRDRKRSRWTGDDWPVVEGIVDLLDWSDEELAFYFGPSWKCFIIGRAQKPA